MESEDLPTHLNFKTSPEGAKWITTWAAEHDVTRTEVIRCALKVAANHPDELSTMIVVRKN